MNPENDIYGNAIKSYFIGNLSCNLTLHSELSTKYDIPVETFFRAADSLDLDRMALSMCRGDVLDVGAGAGGHSLFLQNNGHKVTAIDISPACCFVLKARGVRKVIRANILDYPFRSKFDTWLVLGRSIGAVGSIEGLKRFLVKSHQALNPVGRIVLNSQNIPSRNSWQVRNLQFEFGGKVSQNTPWLDIGDLLLEQEARAHGFSAKVIGRDDYGNYVSLLEKNS